MKNLPNELASQLLHVKAVSDSQRANVVFVMEQHLGHQTYDENLRQQVNGLLQHQVYTRWVDVTYADQDSFWQQWLIPSSLRGTFVGRQQVRRGLNRRPYDVAFFNTQVPAALSHMLVQKRPYILSTDLTPLQYDRIGSYFGHSKNSSILIRRYKHWINRRLFQGAAKILPWSQWARRSFLEEYGVSADKIELLPPGVDVTLWQPGHKRSDGPLQILFVGSDFYRKGGMDLLSAFDQLPTNMAELILVTKSNIPSRPGIQVFREMQPNSPALINLYQSCDLFVLPSRSEPFGFAAVEAGAVGLPVIATAVNGLVDIVIDGKTGFLIEPGDVAGLANRLRQLAADRALARRLGMAGRARVEATFNAARNTKRLLHIIQEVIAEK